MALTVSDCLERASLATDAAARELGVRAAMAQVKYPYEWRSLLQRLGAPEFADLPLALVANIADLTLEAALQRGEINSFREVAHVRATRLDDGAGARRALESAVDWFQVKHEGHLWPMPAFVWVLLGRAFATTLNDAARQRWCLERGLAFAERSGDVAELAVEWAGTVDRGEGVASLHRAEGLVDPDAPHELRAVATAWFTVGEPGEGERVLRLGVAGARSSHDAAVWASLANRHQRPEVAAVAIARAEALASNVLDWLDFAEHAASHQLGASVARRATERAEALADSPETRARVAFAYKQWVGDDAAATRLGLRGRKPEPAAAQLLDWLRVRLTRKQLEHIAQADYGHDFNAHLAVLEDVCATGVTPFSLDWVPHEVLALTRWSQGENVDHLVRAFCATMLILVPGELDELCTNGVILAESCAALGPAAVDGALALFRWCQTSSEARFADPAFATLLLLLLAAQFSPGEVTAFADEFLRSDDDTVASVRTEVGASLRADLWRELLAAWLEPLAAGEPAVARVLTAVRGG